MEFHPFANGGSEGIVSLYEATENWGHTILEYRSPIEVIRWKVRDFGEGLGACQDGPHTSWRCMNEHWPPAPLLYGQQRCRLRDAITHSGAHLNDES